MFVLFVRCTSVSGSCLLLVVYSVGCSVLSFDCQIWLLVVVVGSWLSGLDCQVLAVDCRSLFLLLVPSSAVSFSDEQINLNFVMTTGGYKEMSSTFADQ